MRPLIAVLLLSAAAAHADDGGIACVQPKPKPSPGLGTRGDQAFYLEEVEQLKKRCGKDAYRIAVGMTLERVKSCADATFDVDAKNKSVYTFWDGWNNGCGRIRIVDGKITSVERPDLLR